MSYIWKIPDGWPFPWKNASPTWIIDTTLSWELTQLLDQIEWDNDLLAGQILAIPVAFAGAAASIWELVWALLKKS